MDKHIDYVVVIDISLVIMIVIAKVKRWTVIGHCSICVAFVQQNWVVSTVMSTGRYLWCLCLEFLTLLLPLMSSVDFPQKLPR